MRAPVRGEILRVRLDPVEGSEQAGERPALVLSPNSINQNSPVAIVAAITSKRTEKIYPFEALIEPPEGGLTMRSKVMLAQIRTIDQRRIIGNMGVVSDEVMHRVEEALRIAVGLTQLD